jgi:hypothetical protein
LTGPVQSGYGLTQPVHLVRPIHLLTETRDTNRLGRPGWVFKDAAKAIASIAITGIIKAAYTLRHAS